MKGQNVPVLLSVNFPLRTLSENKEADPEPLETLRLRAEVPKNAAKLKAAGIPFAFQSGELKDIKDFVKNVKTATENGLSRIDAVRAMTLDAARILGVDQQLGSIEKGKIANLVVMKGDVFSKDKTITHVFVDGKLFEQPKKSEKKDENKKGGGGSQSVDIGGVWNVTVEAPGQAVVVALTLNQQGKTFSGTLGSSQFGTVPVKNGTINGDKISFEATVEFGGQSLNLSFSGKVNGGEMDGTVDTAQGPVAFSGTKNP